MNRPDGTTHDANRRTFWAGSLFVYVVVLSLNEVDLGRRGLIDNPQVEEAKAWWAGRLHLPERTWDTAYKDGKVYSHFPPMFSILSAAIVPLFGGVPYWAIALLVAPVPWLAYLLFHRLTRSAHWAAVLTVALLLGTSAWPVLERTLHTPAPYYVNQALAMIGALIFLVEYAGRRRLWMLGVGFLVAVWSRQLAAALVIPLVWAAWSGEPLKDRRRRTAAACGIGLVAAALPMTLNALKFGHPLESGYLSIYVADERHPARTDAIAVDARLYGVFSARYLPRNLYYTNVGLPEVRTIRAGGTTRTALRSNYMGTGIWWTTPLLLWIFADARSILADRDRRALLIAAAVVYAALMFYHSTGWAQRGYNRYSLDYLPILFALISATCFQGRRRWASPVMIAWSVLYFCVLIRPHAEDRNDSANAHSFHGPTNTVAAASSHRDDAGLMLRDS